MLRLAVCVTLASLQAAIAFNPSAVAPLHRQRQGCTCSKIALGLCMQSEGAMPRRSLLGIMGVSILLGSQQRAVAKDTAKSAAKPVFVEEGLSYVVKKSADGGPLAALGMSVNQGDFVVINYIAYLRDGTIFDNTVKRGKPVAFQIGKKQVVPGLEKGIMGMKAGEQRQDLVYDVTMVNVGPAPNN